MDIVPVPDALCGKSPHEDSITLWTSLTASERVRGLHWFAARPVLEQENILMQGEELILPRLRAAQSGTAQDKHLLYAALVLAIRLAGFDLVRKRGCRVQGHAEFEKFEQLRQGTLQSLKTQKKAPVRQLLLAHWGDVRLLKKQGTGFL